MPLNCILFLQQVEILSHFQNSIDNIFVKVFCENFIQNCSFIIFHKTIVLFPLFLKEPLFLPENVDNGDNSGYNSRF